MRVLGGPGAGLDWARCGPTVGRVWAQSGPDAGIEGARWAVHTFVVKNCKIQTLSCVGPSPMFVESLSNWQWAGDGPLVLISKLCLKFVNV